MNPLKLLSLLAALARCATEVFVSSSCFSLGVSMSVTGVLVPSGVSSLGVSIAVASVGALASVIAFASVGALALSGLVVIVVYGCYHERSLKEENSVWRTIES
jgi:hypothetical protein